MKKPMPSELVHQEKIRVKTYECGPNGFVYPHDLLRQMQEAASNHADRLKWGFADLAAQDLFWVLSVIRVEIAEFPRFGSEFVLSTWPSGLSRLRADREFLGFAPDGKHLFAASSSWMVLKREKGRPANLLSLQDPFPVGGDRALPGRLRRDKPGQRPEPLYRILVPASALDVNGHVNNTEYARWAFDTLCLRRGRETLKGFQVSYHSEVFAGDELEFGLTAEDHPAMVAGFRTDDGKAVVSVAFF
ncbi:MAG: hypothetical protein K9K64_10980 [Desulfohalobiaceae bacterium]|nr:hypothetical protein [Desulfohalobiaceae bacterium]